MKSLKLFAFLLIFTPISFSVLAQDTNITIPMGGNAFSSKHIDGGRTVTNKGIENWTDPNEYFTVYLRIAKPGNITVSTGETISVEGTATLEFSVNNEVKKVLFEEEKKINEPAGTWEIKDTGYVALTIKGIDKTKTRFPSIAKLNVSGTAIDQKTAYVKNNEGSFFHWGRRGPSVHLNYQLPENANAEWFYNEVTVPAGNDLIGSYFMANGFGEGYFGMQVNSATERRILFSVWSPFKTDDPKSIPESHKITMLKKGENVQTGEFGNEGSGGQSYLRFNWKAGNTYKFLLHGVPGKDSTTTYTAYFFAPEINKWQLIASFKRPQTQTYLKHFHSFLENFIPTQGDQTRMVKFNNQWIADEKGSWTELNRTRFTTDNTGMKGYRMDFAGGVDQGSFFLKNCGFFSQYTVPKVLFIRNPGNKKPVIDFSKLP
ncbi:DUF3472 domain-containing protein [Pedobacter punctiformis]|uniref:DUF3472 domain-containing protein n=1 Tax=Pedobacter punctiformis TaxID=3004097 RepID=A0ABT4L4W1_9SPHI|nr:DUF3472 domain-containing protein [Pedobacter sp. HCMS5-2]MCZ4242947.1 DUF3472 domain-containing protein [Pedobacter sp. HCMS5-2]